MCGINGIIAFNKASLYRDKVLQMNKALAHRGPDGKGLWNDNNIVLGHRRLAIIDLSPEGNQPMLSSDGNLVLVFNGEIFNYRELRRELDDYPFRTGTDSEVIIAAYIKWGIHCPEHFKGMFAFAIWDCSKKELFLGRDRLGVKPLYICQKTGLFIFSSEIRAILATGIIPAKLSYKSVIDYLRYQTVHAPDTILEEIYMLMPGEWMRVETTMGNSETQNKEPVISTGRYWILGNKPEKISPEGKRKKEVHKDIYNLLSKSVEQRMVSDVPFGAFLSGGIDSSAMVGLMSQVSAQPVNTFSVIFDEKGYSESPYSQMIAKKFSTRHQEIHLKPFDFINMISPALDALDHPSGDGPNTWVVSKVTKQAGISMAISGLGGDELFAGYNIFKRLYFLQKFNSFNYLPSISKSWILKFLNSRQPSVQIEKSKELLQLSQWDIVNTYPIMRRLFSDASIKQIVNHHNFPADHIKEIISLMIYEGTINKNGKISDISKAEFSTYMLNTLLRDTDQMSMAHALEVRVPFLDNELVDYVLKVDNCMIYPHSPKQLLVESLNGLLPSQIVNRKKMGFSFPWDHWMRVELKSFCERHLHNLNKYPIFNITQTDQLWQRFLNKDPLITWSRIWPIVVLAHWLEKNGIEG
jgi:asparagine synthase (glutamine-hydrolysing)